MKRASYREAITWLVNNDDCSHLDSDEFSPTPTVAASLVAEIFGVSDIRVEADLRKAIAARAKSKRKARKAS
jgi:hypothetical protein